jgi:hypothetical protein
LLNNNKFLFEVPLQALAAHKGGQIDTSNKPVETLFNGATGVAFTYFSNSSFLKAIKTEHYLVHYKDISNEQSHLYDKGRGYYSSITLKSKYNIDLDVRYWKGHKFFSSRGGPLYRSISEIDPAYGETERQLLFANIIYNKQLFRNVFFDIRFEPYYDLKNKFFEYAYSVFLRFNKDFFLTTIGN